MSTVEEHLRDMFTARVSNTPALDDPATAAIRRGRSVRRRRAAITGASAALATVVLAGSLVVVQDWRTGGGGTQPPVAYENAVLGSAPTTPAAEPQSTVVPRPPGVDLFAAGSIWTAEGLRVAVADPGFQIVSAFRVPAGWLLGGRTETRLVRTDKVTIPLAVGSHWVVSADGARIAYLSGGRLRVANLSQSGLHEIGSTTVVAGAVPVTFAGERVVIGVADDKGQLSKVDHWQPRGAYRPTWKQVASGVYDAPGTDLLGQVPAKAGGAKCLARLTLADDGLRADTTALCGIEQPAGSPPPVMSPDGQWLATLGASGVDIYDLRTVFTGPKVATTCETSATMGLIWESSTVLLAAAGGGVVRCGLDGSMEQASLPADVPSGWRFVPSRPPKRG